MHAKFTSTYSITIGNEANECFHVNFQVGLQACPLRYEGVNFVITSKADQWARQELECMQHNMLQQNQSILIMIS